MNPKPLKTYNPRERICPICGKLFIVHNPTEWKYKRRDYSEPGHSTTRFFCSWGCLQQFRASQNKKERLVLK